MTPARGNWSRFLHRLWIVATAIWVAAWVGVLVLDPMRPEEWPIALVVVLGLPAGVLALGHAIAWAVRGLWAP